MVRFMSLVNCAPPWNAHGCFLDESPVIQQFVIEADGVWGPYLKCNPFTTAEGVPILDEPFLCDYGNSGPPAPVDQSRVAMALEAARVRVQTRQWA